MIEHEEEEVGEEFDINDLPQLASHQPPKPACTDYVDDATFRSEHPLALRALVGGVDIQRGVRPYGLVAVENPLGRKWVYEHSSGLPGDAFRNQGQPCKYQVADLRIRFTWEPGETKLVPALILGGLWQIRDGEIVGGGGHALRLSRGKMPELSGGMQVAIAQQEEVERTRRGKMKVRS
jgi:hypothetical protein